MYRKLLNSQCFEVVECAGALFAPNAVAVKHASTSCSAAIELQLSDMSRSSGRRAFPLHFAGKM
ncbi:hypothetical protein J2Z31_003277 [Sinorhizobium kostiense]|uniref:Uncharacterized protein n=1 Tax=Sinorhizobium kostiense TaxID=76747 RepID=A0ABS4R1H9_9HYPH|nr:hypothetical protein [Sinorhizobium kostiense]MBP2236763.1 hypothetical protein [Sinorhizobium kostiense]